MRNEVYGWWKALNKPGYILPMSLWIIWLTFGTVFYAIANELGWSKGFYMAVNVGYSIGWGYPVEISQNNEVFSIFYVLMGASAVAAALGQFGESMVASSKDWYSEALTKKAMVEEASLWKKAYNWATVYSDKLKMIILWCFWIFCMTLYSCHEIGWTVVDGVYYAVASCSTGGLFPIPIDSSNATYVWTGFFSAVGVPIMALAGKNVAELCFSLGDPDMAHKAINAKVTKTELEMMTKFGLDNDDGEIDRAEFILLAVVRLGALPPDLVESINARFNSMDKHGRGHLTYAEMLEEKFLLEEFEEVEDGGNDQVVELRDHFGSSDVEHGHHAATKYRPSYRVVPSLSVHEQGIPMPILQEERGSDAGIVSLVALNSQDRELGLGDRARHTKRHSRRVIRDVNAAKEANQGDLPLHSTGSASVEIGVSSVESKSKASRISYRRREPLVLPPGERACSPPEPSSTKLPDREAPQEPPTGVTSTSKPFLPTGSNASGCSCQRNCCDWKLTPNLLFAWWRARSNQRYMMPFLLWIFWLAFGTVFYAIANELGWAKGFYMAVNVGYSIGWGYPVEISENNRVFSIFYVLMGASAVAVSLSHFAKSMVASSKDWYSEGLTKKAMIEEANPLKRMYNWAKLYVDKLKSILLWCFWIFCMTLYSCKVVGWTVVDGVYYAVASCSTGGLWAIPSDSPNSAFVWTGFFAAIGVPIMGMAMANVAELLFTFGDPDVALKAINAKVTKTELEMMTKFGLDNGDGEIDRAEFILLAVVRLGALTPDLVEIINARFNEMDKHGRGRLTYQEILEEKFLQDEFDVVDELDELEMKAGMIAQVDNRANDGGTNHVPASVSASRKSARISPESPPVNMMNLKNPNHMQSDHLAPTS